MSETMTNAEFADSISEWLAAFDHDVLYEIEKKCQHRSHGVNRRVLLATLTMDSEMIYEFVESNPEAQSDGRLSVFGEHNRALQAPIAPSRESARSTDDRTVCCGY